MMKLKFWLALLLALILPLKGAMGAAAMLCHSEASQHVVLTPGHGPHSMHEARATGAASDPDAGVHHFEGLGTTDTSVDTSCLACAAICGASPLPVTLSLGLPVLEPAHDWRGLVLVEPPSGALAGLERPPRSI